MAVRALIFEVAERTDGAGPLEETLKWGEPAYLTTHSRSGSTIRLGWKKALPPAQAGACALYFNCNTHLVDTFRTLFPRGFRFEGNRAIVFAPHEAPDSDALALCIRAALNYHRDKKPSRRA